MDLEEVSSDFSNWAYNARWVLLFIILGLILLGFGLFSLKEDFLSETKVEVLGVGEEMELEESRSIRVEVAGEVENPKVYELKSDSRVEDLLIASGGLSVQADREWVEKNLNQAQKLVDGQKVYIPRIGESTKSTEGTVGTKSMGIEEKININSASLKELDSLEGIGAVRAQGIIDNRPYATIEQLIEKKVVPKSVFEKIKDEVTAF